jgi:7-carboxy-7-deazaguanine synthase
MSKLKVAELFRSIQGEGLHTGVPSVFLRTFGCNFRCPSFGLHHTQTTNYEVEEVIKNIHLFKKYDDLPLLTTGCDSYAAVYPDFKHFSPMTDVKDIAESIYKLLPNNLWKDEHLIFTGGEPLLPGWQKSYPDLIREMDDLFHITFETNGTQPLIKELKEFLELWYEDRLDRGSLTFSVSPKLSSSGESLEDSIKPKVIKNYASLYGDVFLKFVISKEDDIEEVNEVVSRYFNELGKRIPVYLMPAGGMETLYNLNKTKVANLALKHGYRFSDRLQVSLWGNAWAT